MLEREELKRVKNKIYKLDTTRTHQKTVGMTLKSLNDIKLVKIDMKHKIL